MTTPTADATANTVNPYFLKIALTPSLSVIRCSISSTLRSIPVTRYSLSLIWRSIVCFCDSFRVSSVLSLLKSSFHL